MHLLAGASEWWIEALHNICSLFGFACGWLSHSHGFPAPLYSTPAWV